MRLAYPQPADIAAYQRRFNCPMYFEQPRTLVYFDIQHLNDPISLANAEVFKLCEQQCQLHASQLAEGDDLANRIRSALVEKPGEFPTVEQMAARLRMGSRTLRRRLEKEELPTSRSSMTRAAISRCNTCSTPRSRRRRSVSCSATTASATSGARSRAGPAAS